MDETSSPSLGGGTSAAAPEGKGRVPQLDLLRALAVFLVLVHHMQPCPAEDYPLLAPFAGFWQYGGWVGVDLFFVLSGFLVSGLLFREFARTNHVKAGTFLLRRGFKIWPPFYAFLIVSVAFDLLHFHRWGWRQFAAEALFVQNYWTNMWPHTWSLAIEEHFYTLLAIAVALMVRFKRLHLIPHLCAVVAAICLGLRCRLAWLSDESLYGTIQVTHLRLDPLMFGVLLAYAAQFWGLLDSRLLYRYRWLLVLGGVLCYAPAFLVPRTNAWFLAVGVTVFYLGGGMLVVGSLYVNVGASLLVRVISRIGMYSYGIYLWHVMVEMWFLPPILNRFACPWPVYAILYFAATLGVGIVTTRLIEVPALKLRERWCPAK